MQPKLSSPLDLLQAQGSEIHSRRTGPGEPVDYDAQLRALADRSREHTEPQLRSPSKYIYTPDEAIAAGLSIRHAPPDPEPCEHCGKPLQYTGARVGQTIITWSPATERCDCPEAAKFWVRYDAESEKREAERQLREKQEMHDAYIASLIGSSGVNKRFRTRTFDRFEITDATQRAYETAKHYADNFDRYAEEGLGLYLEGPYGTGKTHLAAAITLQLLHQGRPCICQTSIEMMGDIKQSFDPDIHISEREVLSLYKRADLLVVDDLGKENPTEWSVATLYDILNARYEDLRPTIITTNYNDAELVERLTPKGKGSTNIAALMSRIKGSSKLVSMVWDDWRGR